MSNTSIFGSEEAVPETVVLPAEPATDAPVNNPDLPEDMGQPVPDAPQDTSTLATEDQPASLLPVPQDVGDPGIAQDAGTITEADLAAPDQDVNASAADDSMPEATVPETTLPDQPESAAPSAPETTAPDQPESAVPGDDTQSHDDGDGASDDAAHEDAQEITTGAKKGEILEGTILRTSATEIVVDVGLNAEGVIQSRELERMDKETLDSLKEGEKVLVYVISPQDQKTGNIILSLQRAQEERDWRDAERLQGTGEVFQGKIDGYNKGGLIVRFGRVRGFVPESQVSRDRRRRTEGADPQNKWAAMRGEDISVKVLEVDRARNRLILSERDAAPQLREAQKSRLLDELSVGDVRVGHVKSVADFGVFVDVGGADGLVHLTELSWKHIVRPADVFKVGQEVKVEVISVDRERKRIGLSIKRQEEDPWTAITRNYTVGQLVQGTITKLTKFGAFARLVEAPEIEGLVHISELADHRVNHPKDVVNEGDVLTLRIVKIDQVERRMGLSLRRVDSPDFIEGDFRRATRPPGEVMPDIAELEAAAFREDDQRRRDRKKGGGSGGGNAGGSGGGSGSGGGGNPGGGGGNKKGGKRGGSRDFDDDYEY